MLCPVLAANKSSGEKHTGMSERVVGNSECVEAGGATGCLGTGEPADQGSPAEAVTKAAPKTRA